MAEQRERWRLRFAGGSSRRSRLRPAIGALGRWLRVAGLLAASPVRDRLGRGDGAVRTSRRPERGGGWSCTRHPRTGEEGHVNLLFLGDSITQGWQDNEVWKRYYGPRNAANFGIGGDRTQHVLWRIRTASSTASSRRAWCS